MSNATVHDESAISENERLLLAREAAADSYRAGGYVYDNRQIHMAFSAGWDAAVEWIATHGNKTELE